MNRAQPLLELTRGAVVEAVHFGSIAVVAADGTLLRSYGDINEVAFLRSSVKPFQALPFIESGGAEYFDLTPREIALACSSHDTAQIHLDALTALQKKVGIEESQLQCGPHLPSDAQKLRETIQQNITPTANFNNCSGKHTALLAFAKMRGLALETYLEFEHPIQREILQTLAEMCAMDASQIQLGIDGCSAPNFAMPLLNAAWGMARFCDPRKLSAPRAAACEKIVAAMTAHSEMVSNVGEFDAELMRVADSKIVTKRGAEGFQIIGIAAGVIHEQGVGVALKVVDGDKSSMDNRLEKHTRVRPPITLEILRQLNALDAAQLATLQKFGPQKTLVNHAGIVTGKLYPVFQIQ